MLGQEAMIFESIGIKGGLRLLLEIGRLVFVFGGANFV